MLGTDEALPVRDAEATFVFLSYRKSDKNAVCHLRTICFAVLFESTVVAICNKFSSRRSEAGIGGLGGCQYCIVAMSRRVLPYRSSATVNLVVRCVLPIPGEGRGHVPCIKSCCATEGLIRNGARGTSGASQSF